MSEAKEHLLGEEYELESEDNPAGSDVALHRNTSDTSFVKSPSLKKYLTLAAYAWAALCTIPALLFFIRLASHVCTVK